MDQLDVMMERQGEQVRIGVLSLDGTAGACFSYDEEYLESPDAVAVSVSLPLAERKFSAKRTKNFFEGLLPEGFTRRSVARWLHVNEEDYLSILAGLGRECLGALRIVERDAPAATPSYEKLSEEQVAMLAREGATKSAELVTKSHLSLTGASGKVGLYYSDSEEWFLPLGEAPSTHIVKQSHVRLDGIVANEQLCMMAAGMLGLDVPESFLIHAGNLDEEEILFATKRYDRKMCADAEQIDGLLRPLRLHQEDFAQALGISAFDKYERKKSGYLKAMFQLLAENSAQPIADQLRLWDMLIFDYLVGNTDNHIKNFSLLYGEDLKTVRLAPAYDIVSTAVYEGSTREMGIYIGNEIHLDRISRSEFTQAAEEAGIRPKVVANRLDALANRFEGVLKEAARRLGAEGITTAETLCERILCAGGYAGL